MASGLIFAALGAIDLGHRLDARGFLMVVLGVAAAVSPMHGRLGRGPAGCGQVLANILGVTAFICALAVYFLVGGLHALQSRWPGDRLIGVYLLLAYVLMVVTATWLSVGVRKSWRRWRGRGA